MEIAQAPENGKTYFQNNISNFVLQKTGTENSISFRLFVSNAKSDSIVENYFFDSDGRITIRDASSTSPFHCLSHETPKPFGT